MEIEGDKILAISIGHYFCVCVGYIYRFDLKVREIKMFQYQLQ